MNAKALIVRAYAGRRRSGVAAARLFAALLALWLVVAGRAESPRAVLERGNAEYAAGRFEAALEAYQRIGDQVPSELAGELLNNLAATYFRLGKLDEARERWVRAAGMRDAKFEAAARYNLGNCDYADALKALEAQHAQAALKHLATAIDQYRDALRLDAALRDARANLELAYELKKQIEEQSQPQSQPSPEQQQEKNDQRSQSSQPSSQPSESDPNNASQDQSEQQSDQQQQEPQQQQPEPQPESQPAPQSQPSQQEQPAAESQPAEAPPQPDTGDEQREQNPLLNLTQQEAERLLQMIRDLEKQRRAMLRQLEMQKHRPVDKDW